MSMEGSTADPSDPPFRNNIISTNRQSNKLPWQVLRKYYCIVKPYTKNSCNSFMTFNLYRLHPSSIGTSSTLSTLSRLSRLPNPGLRISRRLLRLYTVGTPTLPLIRLIVSLEMDGKELFPVGRSLHASISACHITIFLLITELPQPHHITIRQ